MQKHLRDDTNLCNVDLLQRQQRPVGLLQKGRPKRFHPLQRLSLLFLNTGNGEASTTKHLKKKKTNHRDRSVVLPRDDRKGRVSVCRLSCRGTHQKRRVVDRSTRACCGPQGPERGRHEAPSRTTGQAKDGAALAPFWLLPNQNCSVRNSRTVVRSAPNRIGPPSTLSKSTTAAKSRCEARTFPEHPLTTRTENSRNPAKAAQQPYRVKALLRHEQQLPDRREGGEFLHRPAPPAERTRQVASAPAVLVPRPFLLQAQAQQRGVHHRATTTIV